MKLKKLFYVLFVMSLILTGCGRELYEPQLPEDYIVFDNFGFESTEVEEDVCPAFEYNGRTYYFYSYYCRNLYDDEVNEALGRIYDDSYQYVMVSLSYNNSDDYLVNLYEGDRLMAPPNEVYRAIDTRNKEIDTPSFIEPPMYYEEEKVGDRMYQYWFKGKE